jgi:predicted dienelactone hydrolase
MRYGDNGLVVDFDQLADAVDEGDVIVVGFEMTPQRLLIDLRPDDHSPPLIELVEPLGGAHERYAWLGERRPGVPLPDSFVFFVWPHSVRMLEASPLFERSRARFQVEQGLDVSEDLAAVLGDLEEREREDLRRALIGGEGYETIWSRGGEE